MFRHHAISQAGRLFVLALCGIVLSSRSSAAAERPNIVLIMTDDQGWGQTGYYKHPVLKTPHLDAMAANGLRFDRFYAAGPVCSPTRASVLTGRSPERTGVPSHGHPLRRQEKSLAAALQTAGYATGHFGKWHLNGLRGPGVPVLGDDTHHPGVFGFDEWLTVTNFFDMNPIMSRRGEFEEFKGDSSAVIVDEALKFITASAQADKPFCAVIWDGSPHSPFVASAADCKPFAKLDTKSQHHYGELVAFDRAVGKLRAGLRELDVAENTIVWFCSDNGGLSGIKPDTVGGLRGNKGSVYEGGIRVPGIVEWPAGIKPRVTKYPASTMDIFPTLADLLDLPADAQLSEVDGRSLQKLFAEEIGPREAPIPFRFGSGGAWIDNDYKLVATKRGQFELYHLVDDVAEETNLADDEPKQFDQMKKDYLAWSRAVDASIAGKDYAAGKLLPGEPVRKFWKDDERYLPHFKEFRGRPEYSGWLKKK